MDDKALSVKQKENSIVTARELAAQELHQSNSDAVCRKTGASFHNKTYGLTFLDGCYEIQLPDVVFSPPGLPVIIEVLILHYLTNRNNKPMKEEFINFSTIPNGMFYYSSFQKRALGKLLQRFGQNPETIIPAAVKLGGKQWGAQKYSYLIPVLPKIDMVVQIFEADHEFPAEANILFPHGIVNFLPVEDTAFLGGYLVHALSAEI